jgi:ankyrin repeat protein
MGLGQSIAFVLACGVAVLSVTASAGEDDLSVNARLLVHARNGNVAGVERSLQEGANPDSRSRIGETALVIALKKNDLVIARAMILAGTDVNLAAVNGVTPLMAAAYVGNREMVELLLARGADVNAVDRLAKNAMTYAAGEGRTEIVTLLLAKGVDPNAVYQNDLTALMWAAGNGKPATVKALLAAGAKPGLKDNRGKTALDMAREGNYTEVVALLETR